MPLTAKTPDADASGVFPTVLVGSLLLLLSVLLSAIAGFAKCVGNLLQVGSVLAVPLAAELVSVRALPVGAVKCALEL